MQERFALDSLDHCRIRRMAAIFGDRAKLVPFFPAWARPIRRFLVGQVDCRAIGNVDRGHIPS